MALPSLVSDLTFAANNIAGTLKQHDSSLVIKRNRTALLRIKKTRVPARAFFRAVTDRQVLNGD